MQLVRFDPWATMRDFDRLFEGRPVNRWAPRVDILDREDGLQVRAEVPGATVEDIEVTVEAGTLTIKGGRKFENEEDSGSYHRKEILEGSFERSIQLPEGIDPTAVKATSKDGILEITVPKLPEVMPRKVSVEIQR